MEQHAAHGRRRPVVTVAATLAAGLLVALLSGLAVLAGSGPAAAHSALVASTPAEGDTVSRDVDRLTLVFDTELVAGAGAARVVDPTGAEVTSGKAAVLGDTLEVGMALTTSGRHEVSYRVTGADGHVVEGTYSFAVRVPAQTAAAQAALPLDATTPASSAATSITATPAAAAVDGGDDAPSWLPWGVVGSLLVLALAAVRRRAPTDPSDTSDRSDMS